MRGNFQHRLVPHDAAARQVALLRRLFTPCRQRAEHTEKLAVGAAPNAKAAPCLMRVAAIDRRVDKIAHLLGEPGGSAVLGEEMLQPVIDGAQMHDIGQRVIDLPLGQRPVRPVGKARGLVEAGAGEPLYEGLVADRIAKTAHHRGDLGVKDGVRHRARELEENLQILARRVKHLEGVGLRHQRQQWLQIDALGQGVDRDRLPGARHLHDAEDRPVGALAHELGIDGDEFRPFLAGAECRHGVTVRNQAHCRGLYHFTRRRRKPEPAMPGGAPRPPPKAGGRSHRPARA